MMQESTHMAHLAPSKRPRSLWVAGTLGAIAIHLGCVALAAGRFTTDLDDDLGASAIEVGVELESPHSKQTDLAPGPEAEASAASAAVTEQVEKVERSALPKAEPTETEDPDRQVAREEAIKPDEKKPDATKTPAKASNESVASEAMAPPVMEAARESLLAKAPAQGSGVSSQNARTTWQKQLIAHLNRNKRYPADAAHRNVEILLNFTLDRMGNILSATIKKSSGEPSFDKAVLEMMQRSNPAPKPPPLVADEGLNFTVPVVFRDKTRG
jgi:periplasmic protein TonB